MRGSVRTVDRHRSPLGGEQLVWLAGRLVIAVTLVLAAVELARVILVSGTADAVVAAVATAIYVPLHVWHLRYGLRGERPPRSLATLAVVVAVQFAALAIIGPAWSFTLAIVATSSLIVLRSPWSWLMVAACVLAPLPADALHPQYLKELDATPFYLVWSVAYRACLQFVLVWLAAGAHELVVTREALARQAADREQMRLEASMRVALQRSLVRLAAEARRAGTAVLEPGVAAGLVTLDRVFALATRASDELRGTVLQALRGDAGANAASAPRSHAHAPVERGLSRPGARRSFVAVHVVVLGVVLLAALGAFGGTRATPQVIPAWIVLTAIQLSSLHDIARGLRPRWAVIRLVVAVVVSGAMMAWVGESWRDPGWFAGVAVAVAFRGRTRIVALGLLFVLAGGYDAWRAGEGYSGLGVLQGAWWFAYAAALTALGVFALYGSARLIMVLGLLDEAREEHVRDAVQTEQRRAWRELHDVLGQTLVAISLKADLARRLLPTAPDRSYAEIEELTRLAGDADELAAIAHGEREVSLQAELRTAVSLLHASGIEVCTEVEPGELDPSTSVLLGLALREGTTNILRHARARRVWVRAIGDRDRLVLEIRNDGAAGEMRPGTGLHSLSERAAAVDGEATASMSDDGIFTLAVSVPVRERERV